MGACGLDDIICKSLFHALGSGTLQVSLINQITYEASADLGGLRAAYKQWLNKQFSAISGEVGTSVGHPNVKQGVAEAGVGSEFSARLSRCILRELDTLSAGFASGVGFDLFKAFFCRKS